ncbi:MAG: NADH-quinone oxidoreductase subunit N [Planctomycetes bacterium]|nr:NADH-quinone oxidoreductase subunit N [Planctomycetota bacterium]
MHPTDLFPLLMPVVLTICGALVVLGSEPFLQRAAKHAWLPWIAAVFLVAAGVAQVFASPGHVHGLFAMDTARMWLCGAIIASTLCALAGLQQTLGRDDYAGGEPYALTLFAAAGAMLMAMSNDSLALFLALEMTSLAVYALVGLRRHRRDSNEGLFKYFIMGAVFSAIFLYGAALTYGATGFTRFGHVAIAGRADLFMFGQLLIIIGLLFKIGAVPFHFWSPDAYTGAPVAITGFMGAVVKVGGFAALGAIWLNLVSVSGGVSVSGVLGLDAAVTVSAVAKGSLRNYQLILMLLGLLSVVLGNFSALKQTSVRRMIAFSSVAHAGYMLLAFAVPSTGDTLSLGGLWFYLVGYAIATAGAMSAIAAMSGADDANDTLSGLSGQGRATPFYGLTLTVFLASFAGFPPTAGFLGKFLVFTDLVAKGWWMVAVFAMIMAVIGAAYYLRLVIALWASPGKERPATGPTTMGYWTIAAAAAATIVLISLPGALYRTPTAPAADKISMSAPTP